MPEILQNHALNELFVSPDPEGFRGFYKKLVFAPIWVLEALTWDFLFLPPPSKLFFLRKNIFPWFSQVKFWGEILFRAKVFGRRRQFWKNSFARGIQYSYKGKKVKSAISPFLKGFRGNGWNVAKSRPKWALCISRYRPTGKGSPGISVAP